MKNIPIIILCLIVLLFSKKRYFNNTDYKSMLVKVGVIIDVRSKGEFYSGHIKGSLNIPISELTSCLNYLNDKDQPIITCCASGLRSVGAAKLLSANGYTNVVNGGGWSILERKLK